MDATLQSLDELQQTLDAACTRHQEAFERRESVERELHAIQTANSALLDAASQVKATLGETISRGISAIIGAPGNSAEIAAKVTNLREQHRLLARAGAWHGAYALADGHRALLIARIDEMTAHQRGEEARLAHHDSALADALQAVVNLEGSADLRVSGGVADQIRAILSGLARELGAAHDQLKRHDAETTAARAALGEK